MSGTRLSFLRPFTTHVFNRISRPFVGHLPGFGVVIVRGRKTGRIRHVPMNVFRTDDGYVMALTYGRDVDWVKNVLAAGGCRLKTRGRIVELRDPQLIHDPSRRLMPPFVRVALRLMGVNGFLRLRLGPAVE
jgi:deazaflavin-dependent oxidoreductase (nitroreductase family)